MTAEFAERLGAKHAEMEAVRVLTRSESGSTRNNPTSLNALVNRAQRLGMHADLAVLRLAQARSTNAILRDGTDPRFTASNSRSYYQLALKAMDELPDGGPSDMRESLERNIADLS